MRSYHAPVKAEAFWEPDLPYTAWPYGCLWFDQSANGGRGQFVQLYTAGAGHVANDRAVFCRVRASVDDPWEDRVLVSSNFGGATVHAAGMVPGGDYWAIVRWTNTSNAVTQTRLVRSQDKGATWQDIGEPMNSIGGNMRHEEWGDLFVTQSGAILTWGRFSSGTNWVARTTVASPLTWVVTQIDRAAVGNSACLEGKFVQLNDGTIYSIVRHSIDAAPYTTTKRPVWTVSTDDGVTWTPLAYDTSVECSNGNFGAIYDPTTDELDLYWSSRFARSDGLGSLYYLRTSGQRAKNGRIGSSTQRIFTGASARDFGYPAVAEDGDGNRLLTWYDGTATETRVYEAVMRPIQDTRNTDYTPGGHIRRVTSATRT